MEDRTYRYRLMVDDMVVYESTIEDVNPKHALSWGFYWMPNNWIQRERHRCARVHAAIRVDREDKLYGGWKHYDNPYLEDASRIRNFGDADVKHVLAGQDLVWQLVDRDGELIENRVFRSYEDAEEYTRDKQLSLDAYIVHTWVDGWYAEAYTWKTTKVKGYED